MSSWGTAVLFVLAIFAIGLLYGRRSSNQSSHMLAHGSANGQQHVPAFHAEPPTGPLPATIDPKEFRDTQTQNIYTLAAEVKEVLYQQPCYCHCDRHLGHKSLLHCFLDKHGSECELCKKEAVYSYLQTKAGKTPAEVREEIIQGTWMKINLSKYNNALSARPKPS